MKTTIRIAKVEPWDQGEPAIHGPSIYGASVNKPFLHTISATGERPLTFSAEGLPEGLQLNPANGQINGAACNEGDTKILLRAENRHGNAEKEFTIAIGRGLALTPPMGWNSWDQCLVHVNEATVRTTAQCLIETGLAARGYSYINIDSGWQGKRGGKHDAIQPDAAKFPDLESLIDDIHSLGFKFGIYSTPWVVPWGWGWGEREKPELGNGLIGCSSGPPDLDYKAHSIPEGRYVGIHKHEAQDLAQWVDWGVDFLKYDWTPTDPISLERMGRLVKAASRDIVFSICTDAQIADADAIKAWTHMWRGLPDAKDAWPAVLGNAFLLEELRGDWRPHIKPGSWNDFCLLPLGPKHKNQNSFRPNGLTEDEQITAMTAWALSPSPLLMSCDLSALTDFELRLFANEEVIAVNQDPLGKPAVRYFEKRVQLPQTAQPQHNMRIWVRPLAEGTFAIGFFNLAENSDTFSIDLRDLGFSGSIGARNLWERRDIGRLQQLSIEVPAHGAQLILVGK